ncbi:patatin-like phospholipase family protein [Thermoanaerobacterium thermosaccharolyticum]|uniref:Putative esterase of the alpha-beta hydrolase superfamily n=1 Tax=Thermoanaerobacterium thermosaccharolyticum M0795 TaxID=698948 RepID=L0IN72_THETR|nr:patatin-like phospholipase family protein [Thermoanaerobacterium thermosaccharolyticum]AGB19691.1 putative esterase of the alpha-beta hydrolase superfamily [Thermoanaerobacterium thermosaccharolyticum M0795]
MRPKVGLILGGGAARGYAHLGVLKKLEEKNIPIDFIIGTSIGALIGAIYASGNDLEKIIKDVRDINFLKLIKILDLNIPQRGFIKGDKIEKFLSSYMKKDFDELKIPLYAIATDIKQGREIIFSKGSVIKAVRASISILVVFEPVEFQNTKLVDGSIINFDAIDLALKLGADIIIISDVSSNIDIRIFNRSFYNFVNNIKRILQSNNRTIYFERYFNSKKILPEIITITATTMKLLNDDLYGDNKEKNFEKKVYVIKPKVNDIRWYRFDHAEKCINLGLKAAEHVIQEVYEDLRKSEMFYREK